MPKGPATSNQSPPNSELQQKKKYSAPQCIAMTSNEAKARLKPDDPGDPAAKQLLERIVQLEVGKREQR
jgi:hypothetical protein